MKGRESGMPEADYWRSFFNFRCILQRLECDAACREVVEFGCGYGDFTIAAASVVQQVHAFDIEPEMVEMTTARAQELGLPNVRGAVRDFVESGTCLPDNCADFAMLFNILHIECPVTLLEEARRLLRPGGKVGVIHWNYDPSTPRGPSMDIRPKPEQCRDWGLLAGLEFARWEPLPCCRYHYGLLLRKPA